MTLFRQCFPTDPIVRELGPEEIIARGLPFTYWCEFLEDWTAWSPLTGTITIPKGFISDGGSVPGFIYNIVSDTAPYILFPAYVHDFIFSLRGILPNGKKLTRGVCNQVIGYLMRVCRGEVWRIAAVRIGLGVGSWWYWNKSNPPSKVESAKRIRNKL